MGPKSPMVLEAQIKKFNEKYPPGTLGFLTRDNGSVEPAQTRSDAWIVGGHTAVVLLEGISGGYQLDRFKPMQ